MQSASPLCLHINELLDLEPDGEPQSTSSCLPDAVSDALSVRFTSPLPCDELLLEAGYRQCTIYGTTISETHWKAHIKSSQHKEHNPVTSAASVPVPTKLPKEAVPSGPMKPPLPKMPYPCTKRASEETTKKRRVQKG